MNASVSPNLVAALSEARAAVDGGCGYAVRTAPGGFRVACQRTDHNNCRKARIVTHVWRDGNLLRKAALAAELAKYNA